MVNKFIVRSLAFLIVASAFFVVGKSLFQADWESRPTNKELKGASDALILPPDSILTSEDQLSRLTYVGSVKNVESRLSEGEVGRYYVDLAEKSGWELRKGFESKRNFRRVFCSGKFAYDIEVLPREGGTRIRAGSYWFADKGDDRFCR